jgi:NTE family protein
VPGTWPPVPIDGRDCMDGGIWSLTNADLAAGSSRIVVVAPFGWGDDNPVSGHLRAELALLERHGGAVTVIMPDEAARTAMSDNPLDPARRPASLTAGLAQAARLAAHAAPSLGTAAA